MMKRRDFFKTTSTFTGGVLLLPDFLLKLAKQTDSANGTGEQSLVFIQLNGGNDGLNTFIPFDNPLYYDLRPNIAIPKTEIIAKHNGMGWHPSLQGLAQMQQEGQLSVLQNVGYPEPDRSHFRSQEIWQTGTGSKQYATQGWLGRFLDLQCNDHCPTAGINLDTLDNLALVGREPNFLTISNPTRLNVSSQNAIQPKDDQLLSENPQLDFVRKIALTLDEGSDEIAAALKRATKSDASYPDSALARNLEWISKLMKGGLGSKVYYTSLNGFDTHDRQLFTHKNKLEDLNKALFAFYKDLSRANLLQQTTIIVFSEFGRRPKDNGHGTDHGTAAPMFIIGGNNKASVIGKNPNLSELDKGDLRHEIDFRSVYTTLLKEKFAFDAKRIGIENAPLLGLF